MKTQALSLHVLLVGKKHIILNTYYIILWQQRCFYRNPVHPETLLPLLLSPAGNQAFVSCMVLKYTQLEDHFLRASFAIWNLCKVLGEIYCHIPSSGLLFLAFAHFAVYSWRSLFSSSVSSM